MRALITTIGLLALTLGFASGCGGDDDKEPGTTGSARSELADATRAAAGADDGIVDGEEEEDGVIIGEPSLEDLEGLPEVGVGDKSGACLKPPPDPTGSLAVVKRATLCLLNAERSARGLKPLRSNPRLARAATVHARDMVSRGYFDHNSPGGGTFDKRVKRAGYLKGARSWMLGENIAWGSQVEALPAQTVKAWMDSPPHKANILDRTFREIGIGVAVGAPGEDARPALTYATEFGLRR